MRALGDENETAFERSKDFESVKMEYFKNRAKAAMESGNHREAYETYTRCLDELRPRDASERAKLLCNRSMAYAKSSNYKAALEDADTAISISPNFAKAWWRRAAAHVGLRQFPEALAAYKGSFERQTERDESVSNEHIKAMNRTITSFTCEQLGAWIIEALSEMEKRELMEPAHLQKVTSLEMSEAMFRQIRFINEHAQSPGDYYRFVQRWNVRGMSVPMAYVQRAGMYRHALCFKQARTDAAAALTLCQNDPSLCTSEEDLALSYKVDDFSPFTFDKVLVKAWAWFEMGSAFEEQFSQGDMRSAAKCFGAISQLGTTYPAFVNAFRTVCSKMSDVDAGTALSELNDQHSVVEYGLRTLPEGSVTYLINVDLSFASGKLVKFNAEIRDNFRESVAARAGIGKDKVLIEQVRSGAQGGVVVAYRILVEEDKLKAEVRQFNAFTTQDEENSCRSCLKKLTNVTKCYSADRRPRRPWESRLTRQASYLINFALKNRINF